jgi:hypothetical protein
MKLIWTAKHWALTMLPAVAWLLSELANAGVMVTLGRAIVHLRSQGRSSVPVPSLMSRDDLLALSAASPALSSVSRRV